MPRAWHTTHAGSHQQNNSHHNATKIDPRVHPRVLRVLQLVFSLLFNYVLTVFRRTFVFQHTLIKGYLPIYLLTYLLCLLFRPYRVHSVHKMRDMAADGVAWSVCD